MKLGCALGLSLVCVAGMATSAMGQMTIISNDNQINDFEESEIREIPIHVDSGLVRIQSPQAGARDLQVSVWEEIVEIPDAEWVRVRFSEVVLARSTENVRESYLRITSLQDGYEQYLDADSLKDWSNTTAYFNGTSVKIELMASPNATHQFNRVSVSGVQASEPVIGPRSICGSVDDRILSFDNRDGRLMPIGCTGWLFSDHGSRFMSAAHCGPAAGDVMQFNVPLSTSSGATQNPHPDDQYPVDGSSVQDSIGGVFIGNDWAYYGTFDNSNTGMSPGNAYGVHHTLAEDPIAVDGRPIRITGYGSTSSPVPRSWNLVQKTHVGPIVSFNGNIVRYSTDTTGGNSGSAILDENNNQVIGVHTNAGCNSGGNQGTGIFNSDLQNALANPLGVCLPRNIQTSLVFEPTHIQPEGGDVVTLMIDNLQGHTLVGVPTMYISVNGGSFTAQSMSDNGDGTFDGTFSSYDCGSSVQYYFETEDEEGTIASLPFSGRFRTVALDELTIVAEDDFQTNMGWSSVFLGGSGGFSRQVPADWGLGDPTGDADGSGMCYVTSNGNGSDVDNGSVGLMSPVFDVSSLDTASVRFSAWMTGSGPDSMLIEFSDDAGSNWVQTKSVSSTNGWEELSYVIGDHVSMTDEFRMRVTVTDAGADSTVEGGFDAFKISREVCDNACAADLNGDGVLNFFDVSAFLSAFSAMNSAADFNGDGNFDFFDVSAFLGAFSAGCP